MSARVLTAYVVSISLLAGIISQALAKPPDLPAKHQINCEKPDEKLVLKTYQVADLVVPFENAPWVLPTPVQEPVKFIPGLEPEPVKGTSGPVYELVPAPVPLPAPGFPQPFGSVMFPAPPAPLPAPVPFPLMAPAVFGLATTSPTPSAPACCPACASAHCNGCKSDSPCQAPGCAAPCCAATPASVAHKTQEDQLIHLIVSTVKPESWDVNGGHGTIDYFPLGMVLTVNQTLDVHEQIMCLLEGLHRLQDEQIAIEVRFISLPEGLGEKVACKAAGCCDHCESPCCDEARASKKAHAGSTCIGTGVNSDAGLAGSVCCHESASCSECCSKNGSCAKQTSRLTFLSDAQVQKFMDAIQAHPKTDVMMAPKVTVINGQTATVSVVDNQFFVTNAKRVRQGDQEVFVPQNEQFETGGFRFSVKATESTDHRFVQMRFQAQQKTLDSPADAVPLYPVTTTITPIYEGGAQGRPEPFTLFLQQPCINVQAIEQAVCVPCGQTALFHAWKKKTEVRDESGVPILSCLPYVGDMFKTVSYHPESADVWIMITPKIVTNKEDVHAPVAAAPATVTDNLQKLQQAQALLEQADHCRRMGQTESALHIYEKVQRLCPGSRYAQMAARRLMRLQAQDEEKSQEVLSFVNGHLTKTRVLASDLNGHVTKPFGNAVFVPAGSDGLQSPRQVTHVLTSDSEPKMDPKVSEYLTHYWQACAEGRMSEATQWAIQALALDPACFSKARDAGSKKTIHRAVMPSAN
jgi:general secretion pathway protein D